MDDNIKMGNFNIGGSEWTVNINNRLCEVNGVRWCKWLSKNELIITDSFGVGKVNYDVLEHTIWDGIITIVISNVMEFRELENKGIITAFSNFFHQAISTMTCKPGEWDGSFQLGAFSYIVKVDNEVGNNENFYGRCNPNLKVIQLVTDSNTVTYSDDFIYQTLFHEIVHAVNHEIGKGGDSKMDSEKFVNTLSIFLYEVYKTLKIKFPDEANT